MAGTGVGIGLLLAVGLTRLISSLLFEVSTLDPVAYLVSTPLLLLVSLLACYLPAFRASQVDPLLAIRSE